MATIFEVLTVANTKINDNNNLIQSRFYKKRLDQAVKLLLKGYRLDDQQDDLITQYKTIEEVPDAKVHAGQDITNILMTKLGEDIFPQIPHGSGFLLVVFKFADPTTAQMVSNGERPQMVQSLRSLAESLEGGVKIDMAHEN